MRLWPPKKSVRVTALFMAVSRDPRECRIAKYVRKARQIASAPPPPQATSAAAETAAPPLKSRFREAQMVSTHTSASEPDTERER